MLVFYLFITTHLKKYKPSQLALGFFGRVKIQKKHLQTAGFLCPLEGPMILRATYNWCLWTHLLGKPKGSMGWE